MIFAGLNRSGQIGETEAVLKKSIIGANILDR
jgi:hypothetical protein